MVKSHKHKVFKKTARIIKADAKAIVVKGKTKTHGVKTFSFTPLTARALKQKRNKAYQYFSID